MAIVSQVKQQMVAHAIAADLVNTAHGAGRLTVGVEKIPTGDSGEFGRFMLSELDGDIDLKIRWSTPLTLGSDLTLSLVDPKGQTAQLEPTPIGEEPPLIDQGRLVQALAVHETTGATLRIRNIPEARGPWSVTWAHKSAAGQTPGTPAELAGAAFYEVTTRGALQLRHSAPAGVGTGQAVEIRAGLLLHDKSIEGARLSLRIEGPEGALDNLVVGNYHVLHQRLSSMTSALGLPPARDHWWNLDPKDLLRAIKAGAASGASIRGRSFRPEPEPGDDGFVRFLVPEGQTTVPGTYNYILRAETADAAGRRVTRIAYGQFIVFVRPEPEYAAADIQPIHDKAGHLRYRVDLTFKDRYGNIHAARDADLLEIVVPDAQNLKKQIRNDGTTRLEFSLAPDIRSTRRLQVHLFGQHLIADLRLHELTGGARPALRDTDIPGRPDPLDPSRDRPPITIDPRTPLVVRRPKSPDRGNPVLVPGKPPGKPTGTSDGRMTVYTANTQRSAPYLVEILRGDTARPIGVGWGTESFSVRQMLPDDRIRISVAADPKDWPRQLTDARVSFREPMLHEKEWRRLDPTVVIRGVMFG